ncbi:TcfC E-set like domain-containing protein [Microbulbifer thermotolerans]|uniref:TcfC E-set like domain-containing protein n=1 Tax=Microbulbifer thermotolerans TaxID=252514 RepID=UPI0022499549|nr:TcfC E-set like domain-containing protein [Microbulbifer thermotolerans]MCX2783452.1 TcfC E-set like domain-containing protein [Microbulbifer thermotolerans]MCX2795846.1 TcfC E-set like domain-containing protein [Microbulbifer thermotolerans]MCX2836333.1 TcfC E-set like domain-containing protein [Microbulbifer thermotolerans]
MNRIVARATLALILCAPVTSGLAASAAFTLHTGAPDGFAELTEPQQIVADIYYGSRPLGAAQVTVDPTSVRFENPEAVLELLPPAVDAEAVLALLRKPQPRNSHRLCRSRQQRNCGYLLPEDFALIYDESRFRIDLFFAADLLLQQAAINDPYLPESSSDVSFMQSLSGSWSGVESNNGPDSNSASLYGISMLSFGESGLHSQWSANDESNGKIYQLNWTRDYRGHAWSVGLIQPQGSFSNFLASPYLYGLEYRSSNNSRTDNRYQQGTSLEINMPVRGRVEIHRDGRLLFSQMLEAGNQLLDTSTLPGGAYELEIRTFDENGRSLAEQRRFFVKDSLLPAPGEWRWTLQAGQPAQLVEADLLPEQGDDYFLQAGVSRRLFEDTGLFVTTATTQKELVLELGARWISEYLELSPSVLKSRDGTNGHRIHALLKTPYFTLSASDTQLTPKNATNGDSDNYALLGTGYSSRDASLNTALFGGQVSLRYSKQDSGIYVSSLDLPTAPEISAATRLTTLEFRRDLFRSRRWLGEMTLSHSDADGERLTAASFRFFYRGDNWSHSATLRGDSNPSEYGGTRLGFNSSWQDGDRLPLDLSQQFSGEVSESNHYLASNTRLAGRRGAISSTLDYRVQDTTGQRAFNYLGNFNTTLMTDGNHFAWGGEKTADSALLVDIEGSPDQDFEILVNGARRGYAKGGERSAISLPAFQTYEISLRPLAEGFYDYRELQDKITLYPGNVASASYQIKQLILVLGRLMHNGKPVPHKKITIGEYAAITDEFGVFQLEMYGNPRKLQVPPVIWGDCKVPLPEQSAGQHWVNLGDIELANGICPDEHKHYIQY